MLSNYILTGLRNLRRHRFFSFINIFGLAIAMSICMAMIMLVADQVSYDRHNSHAQRIYRVKTIDVDDQGNVTDSQWNAASPLPLAQELTTNYTGVAEAVRLRRSFGNGWMAIENQDVNVPLAGFFADPNVLSFFEYELQYGDPATALKNPFSVVLTRKAANKLFKDENPVGKTIKVGDQGLYTVTGVLKDTSNKSHIVFEALASMGSAESLEQSGKLTRGAEEWHNYWTGWTYIRLEEGKTEEEIQSRLDRIYEQYITTAKPGDNKMKFGLQPLLRITPGSIMNNSIGPQLPWQFVYFLGGLSLVILLTSCFNFTNLSIARSLTRAREIGVRKVSGAGRLQIFSQFITESVLVAGAALVMAVAMLIFLKPMILQLNLAQLFRWDLYDGTMVYAIFALFAIVVGIMAGLFPAVVLSGFQPVKVLKNLSNVRLFSRMGMRKALLVSQFSLSLFFIATVIIIYNQLNLFTHHDHGFNMKNNVVVKLNNTSYQNFKTELQKYNNITAVSAASHVPAAGTSMGNEFKRKLEDLASINAGIFQVDEDYARNMQLRLLAGEFFNAEKGASNKNFVVINETASKQAHFSRPQDAVGEAIVFPNDTTTKIILGVVSDYNHRDLTREITPMLLLYKPESFSIVQVAYSGSYEKAILSIEKAWSSVNPGLKADYIEVESEINQFYNIVFGDLSKVLAFVSFLAIIISCLGLLGMATYATETRLREISIRKVLGSSGLALVMLLSKGFLGILLISVIIGIPLVWFVNNLWLELIAYHTTVSPGVIAISVLLLMFFGVITVGSQTLRATFVKPVDNLKSE